jgi:hypothetical protein
MQMEFSLDAFYWLKKANELFPDPFGTQLQYKARTKIGASCTYAYLRMYVCVSVHLANFIKTRSDCSGSLFLRKLSHINSPGSFGEAP